MTVQVQADSLPQLFEVVALKITAQFIDLQDIMPAIREKVAIEAPTLETLLNEWVILVLQLLVTHNMVINEFKTDLKIDENKTYSLKAEAIGELLDVQRHTFKKNPALVRPQSIRFDQKGDKYLAEIVLSA